MRVNGMRSESSFSDVSVMTVDQEVARGGDHYS